MTSKCDDSNEMDGSQVAIQVSQDLVTIPASVNVAFTNVQPEVLMAWQNEVYGWQHPNTLTMPFELLYQQASHDMVPILAYFSNHPAEEIHRDDFSRNIVQDPEFINAVSPVHFWSVPDCPEGSEIQRTFVGTNQSTPFLVAFVFNASGGQMAPDVLTNCLNVQEVIGFIERAIRVQQDQIGLRRTRELRAEQDQAYQESLQRDRERARQREEERLREEELERERQRVQREEEERAREAELERERSNAEALREARENLPEEPLAREDTTQVRIRGPDGEVVSRTFYMSDTTQVLYNAAFVLLALPSQNFRIRTYSRVLENDGSDLSTLELMESTVLSIEMLDE
ncbi:hypothetical protein ACROYT_G024011 [Oculina patagonica]